MYAEALALCYVSLYEGFGLPPLEAMACGTPVIYGNNSSMPEVVGDGGLPADALDVDDIERQMERVYREPELRAHLALNAWRRSYNFSWRKMAGQTLDVYDRALSRR
jgi:glycosyltransferase involved in cell wall biosynthesis